MTRLSAVMSQRRGQRRDDRGATSMNLFSFLRNVTQPSAFVTTGRRCAFEQPIASPATS